MIVTQTVVVPLMPNGNCQTHIRVIFSYLIPYTLHLDVAVSGVQGGEPTQSDYFLGLVFVHDKKAAKRGKHWACRQAG